MLRDSWCERGVDSSSASALVLATSPAAWMAYPPERCTASGFISCGRVKVWGDLLVVGDFLDAPLRGW